MAAAALLTLWAALACAQSPMPTGPAGAAPAPPAAPAASTAAATSPPPAVDLSSGAAAAAAPAAAPKPAAPANPIRVKIHKEAKDWEPVSVAQGAAAAGAKTAFSYKLKKKGKTHVGKSSAAKAVARAYPAGDDTRLVISVFPKALEAQRTHIELRFLVVEGYLEKLEAAAVTADPGGDPLDDAQMLREKGVSFQEENPAGGSLKISAIDAKQGKSALNAGSLRLAEFAESDLNPRSLGLATVDYAAKGVGGPAKRRAAPVDQDQ